MFFFGFSNICHKVYFVLYYNQSLSYGYWLYYIFFPFRLLSDFLSLNLICLLLIVYNSVVLSSLIISAFRFSIQSYLNINNFGFTSSISYLFSMSQYFCTCFYFTALFCYTNILQCTILIPLNAKCFEHICNSCVCSLLTSTHGPTESQFLLPVFFLTMLHTFLFF